MADDGVSVKLTGTTDLIAAFRALRNELPRDPTRKPVKAAADWLAAQIQRAAPYRTGALMAAIRTAVSRSKGATHGKITIASTAAYWRFLEIGWHAHGTGTFFQFPFITPTTREHQQTAGQIVIDGCAKEIKKAADRLMIKTAGAFEWRLNLPPIIANIERVTGKDWPHSDARIIGLSAP